MTIDFDDHTRTESARFLAALRDADLSARVPTCPDWAAGDLLYHLTEVHYFWAAIVGRRVVDEAVVDEEIEAAKPAQPDDREELVALFERTTRDMLAALAAADDREPVWTWAEDRSVGFVRRFQAHEAMFHRVDAELASGTDVTALPDDLATDAVDLVLRVQKTWRPGWADWRPGEEIARLEASDTGTAWTVRLGRWSGHSPDTGKAYDGEFSLDVVSDGEPTVTVRAPTAALAGWLWGRPRFGDVETSGDPAHVERVVGYLTAGVQ